MGLYVFECVWVCGYVSSFGLYLYICMCVEYVWYIKVGVIVESRVVSLF